MSYATVMVQSELGRSNAAPLGVARDLAERFHASITGVAAAQPIQMMEGDGLLGGDIVREDNEWIDSQAALAEAEFRKKMTGLARIEWELTISPFSLSSQVANAAGPADILIASLSPKDDSTIQDPGRRTDIDDLVLQTGKPVLAVPRAIDHFGFRSALVAWKECREARRAIADALPLLRLMDKVVLVGIADKAGQDSALAGLRRMASWLERHGVSATPRLDLTSGHDGDRLLELADEEGADLIVAGAYGHSRFSEWVLGGVTRTLLRRTTRCLLLSH